MAVALDHRHSGCVVWRRLAANRLPGGRYDEWRHFLRHPCLGLFRLLPARRPVDDYRHAHARENRRHAWAVIPHRFARVRRGAGQDDHRIPQVVLRRAGGAAGARAAAADGRRNERPTLANHRRAAEHSRFFALVGDVFLGAQLAHRPGDFLDIFFAAKRDNAAAVLPLERRRLEFPALSQSWVCHGQRLCPGDRGAGGRFCRVLELAGRRLGRLGGAARLGLVDHSVSLARNQTKRADPPLGQAPDRRRVTAKRRAAGSAARCQPGRLARVAYAHLPGFPAVADVFYDYGWGSASGLHGAGWRGDW